MRTGNVIVGISGASGAIYAVRLLDQLVRKCNRVYVMLSSQAPQVLHTEMNLTLDPERSLSQNLLGRECKNLIEVEKKNFFTPPASGSFLHDGMVIVPCSMGTAGRIANGISDDLMTRSADVCLKERRKLVLAVRETPFNTIHLRNLTQLSEAGAIILPAAPAWYHNPTTLEDLADTIVSRILQQLDIEQDITPQWKYSPEDE